MKNFILKSLALTLGAMAISCQSDKTIPTNSTWGSYTLTAHQSPLSKSAINNLEFYWVDGDQISVYTPTNSENALFIASNVTSLSSAPFTGSLSAESSSPESIFAVYPYNADYSFSGSGDDLKLNYTIAVEQNQSHRSDRSIDPESLGKYALMTGKSATPVVLSSVSSLEVQMTNVISIIDFEISNISKDYVIKSLTLRSDEASFTSSAQVGFTSNGNAPEVVTSSKDCSQIKVNINNGDGITPNVDDIPTNNNGFMTIRMAMIPQTIEAGTKWFVDLNTSEGTFTYEREFAQAKTYEQGGRYTASIDFTTIIPDPLFVSKYAATASYARKMIIAVDSDEDWSAEEFSDSGNTFTLVSTSGKAGDNLVIDVAENNSTNTINKASFVVTTESGRKETLYIKQGEKLELKPFVESDWSIDSGAPVFDNGKWTLGTSAKIERNVEASAQIELSELTTPDSFIFYYYSTNGSYRSVYFEIDNDQDEILEVMYYEFGDEQDNLTDEEQALVVKKVPYDNTKTNVLSIYNFPTPDGAVLQYYLNEELITEVPAYMTEKALADAPKRYMLRSYSGAAKNSLLRWAESTVALDDPQWEDWSAFIPNENLDDFELGSENFETTNW